MVAIGAPINAPLEPAQADCCDGAVQQNANNVDEHQGCPTDSSQQKQCCAACSACLVFVSPVTGVLLFPPTSGERIEEAVAKNLLRPNPPLVPPPRDCVA
jgi:hypothetical protein